jgi:hypothetical protein
MFLSLGHNKFNIYCNMGKMAYVHLIFPEQTCAASKFHNVRYLGKGDEDLC